MYTYFMYPLLLATLKALLPSKKMWDITKAYEWPKVSLLIAAYNEEKVIEAKIKNSLALDYPETSLDVWVASDGSSDKTASIVEHYALTHNSLHLLKFPRSGKSRVINLSLIHI